MLRSIKSTQREMRQLELIVDGTGTAAISGPASNQVTLIDNGDGDYTITFNQAFANTPVVQATAITADTVCRVKAASTSSVNIETKAITGGTATVSEKTASIINAGVTLYSKIPGVAGNSISYEITVGGTAGVEVVTVTGLAISVQVEDGVSTAQQVVAALVASSDAMNLVAAVASTPATAQAALAATPLVGGQDASAGSAGSLAATDADFHLIVVGSDVADKY